MSDTTHKVPAPAVIPAPTFSDVKEAVHDLLLVVDNIQAHSGPTPYIVSARAMILSAQSQVEAHILAADMIAQQGAQ